MTRLICSALAALILSIPAYASCIDMREWPYDIVQKLDDHTYELSYEGDRSHHVILKTKKAVFYKTGHPYGLTVEETGSGANLTLNNGFTGRFVVFRECKLIRLPQESSNNPALAVRARVKEVDDSPLPSILPIVPTSSYNKCTDACYAKYADDHNQANACYQTCQTK